ncbi:Cell division protein FtsQ [Kordia antarctica]|uniref:Cell division protein FtsQ n=1 Tax=Kordia antarctica TaxID=1218801 RepID=A0A7L4ZPK7_9FLAO|nr:cell division protein FtsQ/DivIB [Kordia antarctica]QHI38407.1 Cell division protein FtsQ [Kordia antarctica]
MEINWNLIKGLIIATVLVFLYAFSANRNAKRIIENPDVKYLDGGEYFITRSMVNKLLIQNVDSVTNIRKDQLDLDILEERLRANEMIQDAEVYLSVNGTLGAKIKQRTPIARIATKDSYYIDSEGKAMPLSKVSAARVPFVEGKVDKKELKNIYVLTKYIAEDDFLKKNVITIVQNENKTFDLKLRTNDFIVQFGNIEHMEKKVNNLKAFYKKAVKDKTLNDYAKVDLKFTNQVVCTKK